MALTVPLGPLGDGYCARHVDMQMKPHQAENLKRMVIGLRQDRAVLADGRYVQSAADALRWVLERLAS